jgi:hypothetical protein
VGFARQYRRWVRRCAAVFGVVLVASVLPACGTKVHFAAQIGRPVHPLQHTGYCPRHYPKAYKYINLPVQVTAEANGDFLVVDAGSFTRSGAKVVEFNPAGKVVWAYTSPDLDFPHSAYPTSRGTVLISDTNNNRVIEVSKTTCHIVWSTDYNFHPPGEKGFIGAGRMSDGMPLRYPNDAKELPDGHLLISSRENSTVFEIDRNNHVFMKCHSFTNLGGQPDSLHGQHNPSVLPGGNIMVADSDNARVVILNSNCSKEVWQFPSYKVWHQEIVAHQKKYLAWPRDAMLMNNHDIMIDDSVHNRCLEVNWHHRVVNRLYNLPPPYSCWPLPSGVVASGDSNTHGIAFWQPGKPAHLAGLLPHRPVSPNGTHRPPHRAIPRHLVNGGCDTQDKDQPIGWQRDDMLTESLPPSARANMGFDKSRVLFGNASCKISWNRTSEHAALWWGQVLWVHTYHWYRFSGWMYTQDVRNCKGCNFGLGTERGNYAEMAVQMLAASPYANPVTPSFPKLRGSSPVAQLKNGKDVTCKHAGFSPCQLGWRKVSMTYYIPSGVRYVGIQLLLAGAGTVWFDGIQAKELAHAPKGQLKKGNYAISNP